MHKVEFGELAVDAHFTSDGIVFRKTNQRSAIYINTGTSYHFYPETIVSVKERREGTSDTKQE